jgi:putative redox protein
LTVTVTTVASTAADASFQQVINAGPHQVMVDKSSEEGGEGRAASPFDLLYGAWGACTNMTLQVYARRKGWPLARVETEFRETGSGAGVQIEKIMRLWGALDEAQVARLKLVAEKCPVNLFILRERDAGQIQSSIQRLGDQVF